MGRIALFFGTRPEAIKMAPVIDLLRASDDMQAVAISTGQHSQMLDQVRDLFGIKIDYDLAAMQPDQSLASLTARLMELIDRVLGQVMPQLALVQGDTTTTFVATLACFYRNIPVGHIEAGLRTGNLRAPFPEEANRILTSAMTTLHFPATESARRNLLHEGVRDSLISVTGNTVIDALRLELSRQCAPDIQAGIRTSLSRKIAPDWNARPFVLVTGHRRESFGRGLEQICTALASLAQRFSDYRFIYPVHLNPTVRKMVFERLDAISNIVLLKPLGYREFVALMKSCEFILTDSGGIQEEAPALGKPVLVMREVTERPEAIEAGAARLVGASARRIVQNATRLLTNEAEIHRMANRGSPYGDGKAAMRIVERVRAFLNGKSEEDREEEICEAVDVAGFDTPSE